MAIIQRKRQDGSIGYQVRVKDPTGQWYPTATFDDAIVARDEELRLEKLKRKGSRALSDDAKRVTEAEFWEVWSVENRTGVSDGWRQTQDQLHRDYVEPVLGDRRMCEIDAPLIGKMLKRVRDLGCGDQQVRHVYNLVRKIFSDAVEYYEMLAASPVKPKFHRPSVGKKKRSFLMPEQAWKLLEHSKGHYLGPAIWSQILSGLRPGEVQFLRGKHLHPELDQILIAGTFNRKMGWIQDHPKQEDWAYAPMPPQLKVYLSGLALGPEEFVAKGPRGGMLGYDTYWKALRRLCAELELPMITPHELRHSSSVLYAAAGASTEDLGRLLNHKNASSATATYIHRTDDRLMSIARRIERPAVGNEESGISQKVSHLGNLERVDFLVEGQAVH